MFMWGPLILTFNKYWALPLEVNQLVHEADHLLPSGAEVKNEWSFMYIPQYAFMACAGTTLSWLDVLLSAWMIQLLMTNDLEMWKEEAVA